ncbi:hypothetical protein EVAR_82628_1 [Eumeta japonica]|uniref:Uncharacterized protein n=1 Tax=Eumeta variegata TaxID=151549 RepID=A0A4C1TCS6_EUMVA|nr:hypothetical protein EVAR_82628_1 [Eumeta japonica]
MVQRFRPVVKETYLRVVACRGAPGAYRFHTFNMVRDIFACRVVTQSVLSWRGLLATDCARAVVGLWRDTAQQTNVFLYGAWLVAQTSSGFKF